MPSDISRKGPGALPQNSPCSFLPGNSFTKSVLFHPGTFLQTVHALFLPWNICINSVCLCSFFCVLFLFSFSFYCGIFTQTVHAFFFSFFFFTQEHFYKHFMFFFLPRNISKNRPWSFFYPGTFIETVPILFLPWNIFTNTPCSSLPWNIATNSASSFLLFFTLKHFYKQCMFVSFLFFTLEHFYKQCMFFIFFLLWNISTNCMFFSPLGHCYKQPLFYYISWIFYSIISVSNFVLCLLFLFTANSWCPGRSMLIYSPTSNQILTAPFLWGLMDL